MKRLSIIGLLTSGYITIEYNKDDGDVSNDRLGVVSASWKLGTDCQ